MGEFRRSLSRACERGDFRVVLYSVQRDHVHLIVGSDDRGHVLASCVLLLVPNLSHDGRSWGIIEHVVVDKSLRGAGIGTQLIQWANDFAKNKGCYKTQLVSGADEAQVDFYKKLGFNDLGLVGFRKYL